MKIIVTVPLLASLSSCNAEHLPTIVDLSQDIPRDEAAIASSPGAMAVQHAASQDPKIRAFMVIENGSIVSSYLRDDVDPKEPVNVFSLTKSWMSSLFGTLVDGGLLSLNETLGDIFPEDDAWAGVTDGSTEFRKGVTVEELLTMTSGLLSEPCFGEGDTPAEMLAPGGNSLQEALSNPSLGVKGGFRYICLSQIPSYIIVKRTGMTPRQYLAEQVMGKLGIGEDEYDWLKNLDGVEQGFCCLHLTPMQTAKFGQLYLQGGRASPSDDEQVISQEWIDASLSHQATMGDDLFPWFNASDVGTPYGYWWWGEYGGRVYCASGMGGNFVCVDRELSRVMVQQVLVTPQDSGTGRQVLELVLQNSLSFRVASKSGKSTKNAKRKS